MLNVNSAINLIVFPELTITNIWRTKKLMSVCAFLYNRTKCWRCRKSKFYFQTDVFAMMGVAGLLRSSCLSLSSQKQGTTQGLCAHARKMTPGSSGEDAGEVKLGKREGQYRGALLRSLLWAVEITPPGPPRIAHQRRWQQYLFISFHPPRVNISTNIHGVTKQSSYFKSQNCVPTCLESRVWARRYKAGTLRGTDYSCLDALKSIQLIRELVEERQ